MRSKLACRAFRTSVLRACSALYSAMLLMLRLALRCLLCRLLFGCGFHYRWWFGGTLGGSACVVPGAIGVRAYSEGASGVLAEHDDGGFGVAARWLSVRVVGNVELPILVLCDAPGRCSLEVATRFRC